MWITIEYGAFIAIILSNEVFLYSRAFKKIYFTVDQIPEKLQLPSCDTIAAIPYTVRIFTEFCAQLIISIVSALFLVFVKDSPLYFQLIFMIASNLFSVIAVWILIFVSREKGGQCWIKFAPYFYAVLTVSTWLIVPITNVII